MLEKLVAECFRAVWQHVEVVHVGKPGDGGVDVLFVTSQGDRWIVQCKRRSAAGAVESVETVRALLGALVENNSLRGVVVSTAKKFRVSARHLSEKMRARGCRVELFDASVRSSMSGASSSQAYPL